MGYIIDIKPGITPRELLAQLEYGFAEYMDTPLAAVETFCDECCGCEPCSYGNVIRMKIEMGEGLELRIYYE